MSESLPSAESDAGVASLAQHRADKRPTSLPRDRVPAITFFMDDDRIIFRDEAALDEYVAGVLAPVQALVRVFEAKFGVQSSPVALLREALTSVTSPTVNEGGTS